MPKNLFESGINYDQFFKESEEKYKTIMENIFKDTLLQEETTSKLEKISEIEKFLVVGEAWCPDCIINITALEYIKRLNVAIEYSIISKEQAGDYFIDYYHEGRLKIPSMFLLDEEYNIVNGFIEKPEIIKRIDDSNNQVERIKIMKDYRSGKLVEETILEILEMILNKKSS